MIYNIDTMPLKDLGAEIFKPIHELSTAYGTPRPDVSSYVQLAGGRDKLPPQKPKESHGLIRYANTMHRLFRNTGIRLGNALGALPADIDALVQLWSEHNASMTDRDYTGELDQKLAVSSLAQLPVELLINGEKQTVLFANKELKLPYATKSLAYSMFALGKAGLRLDMRPLPEYAFINTPLNLGQSLVEAMQCVKAELSAQLKQKGIPDPERVLRDSGLDMDRTQFKRTLFSMGNILAIYQLAAKLGNPPDEKIDSAGMIKMLGNCGVKPVVQPILEDAYEAQLLLDSVEHYLQKYTPAILAKHAARDVENTLGKAVEKNPGDAKALLQNDRAQQLICATREAAENWSHSSILRNVLDVVARTQKQRDPIRRA